VIKLFPRAERSHFEAEVAALTRLDGALSIPTPRVVASGERDGRWYVVMSRLAGRPLCDIWPELAREERLDIVRQVGTGLAELHARGGSGLPALSVDWREFLDGRRAGNGERQAAKGLGAPWLGQVDAYLDRWFPRDDGRRALLHTEVMREHLLVDRRDGAWRVSGLFDFEPAMIGAPEYEFASVGLFVTCAEPGLFGAALEAYGAPAADEELPYRILAYTLLHRYSHLRWYLERLPSEGCRTLEALARRWFAV
jgi:hygromycin-B 7''-O-kinase